MFCNSVATAGGHRASLPRGGSSVGQRPPPATSHQQSLPTHPHAPHATPRAGHSIEPPAQVTV